MASRALTVWQTDSSEKLDELVTAHASVGGVGPGRRYATEQINASLVVQLAAHLQRLRRDLHTGVIDALVKAAPTSYWSTLTHRHGLEPLVRYPVLMAREKAEFAQGTKVGVRFSGRVRPATAMEGRGIFSSGHRIVRVRIDGRFDGMLDEEGIEALECETWADELEPVPTAA